MQFEDQTLKTPLVDLLDSLAVLDRDSDYYLATENIIKAKFDRLINILSNVCKDAGAVVGHEFVRSNLLIECEFRTAVNNYVETAMVAEYEVYNHTRHKDKHSQ